MIRRGFSARSEPSAMESFVARKARALAVPSKAKTMSNPLPDIAENLRAGMEHFADHCPSCHSNNGAGDTELGRGTYPKPPDMRTGHTQKDEGWGDLRTAFGSVPGDHAGHKYTVITLGHIRGFLDEYIERNWYELRQAGSKDPMFQTLLLLRKSRAASTGRDHRSYYASSPVCEGGPQVG